VTSRRAVSRPALNLDYPRSLGVYDRYSDAQHVVNLLAGNDFPVHNVAIVGTELKSVERVTGRLTHGKLAAAGALSGLRIGLLVGIVSSLLGQHHQLGFLLTVPVAGAAFGLIWSQAGLRAPSPGGTRHFSSVTQVVAAKYEVLVEHTLVDEARQLISTMTLP
jgi:hypothetical protein